MANWQRKLRLADVWDKCPGEMSIQELAGIVADRLRDLTPFGIEDIDEERDSVADEFEEVSQDEDAEARDFDLAMTRLYDWGDMRLDDRWNGKKVCWIEK